MPAYVLKCGTCSGYQTFSIEEEELRQLEKEPIVRQCEFAAS